MTAEEVILKLYQGTPVGPKKVEKYKSAPVSKAQPRDLEIPEDATVYIKKDGYVFWSLGAFFCEVRGEEVKVFWL